MKKIIIIGYYNYQGKSCVQIGKTMFLPIKYLIMGCIV